MDRDLSDVLAVVGELASACPYHGHLLNERYLHHHFSNALTRRLGLNGITVKPGTVRLHPEWPTFKKKMEVRFAKYRKVAKKYMPLSSGGPGFIDFGIGDYARPHTGVEFTLKGGWAGEEIVYDFVKLMDARNPFQAGVSYNVVLRPEGLSKRLLPGEVTGLDALAAILITNDGQREFLLDRLQMGGQMNRLCRKLNDAYDEAKTRLAENFCSTGRQYFFVLTELAPAARRHWYFDKGIEEFRAVEHPHLPPFFQKLTEERVAPEDSPPVP